MPRLKLALIGCGNIAELVHLPVLALSNRVELAALVDVDPSRAATYAVRYSVPGVFEDHRALPTDIQAAIVATPPSLHAPIAVDLVRRGLHVLVEKPMALTAAQCVEMTAAAGEHGVVLAVGMVRRFVASSRLVKALLESNALGEIRSVDFREGVGESRPVTPAWRFDRKVAGGGVLMNIGSHVLDLLLWWLGDWTSLRYRDDAEGGVEAECEVELAFESGAHAVVELSHTRVLRNSCVVSGTRGVLEVGAWGRRAEVRLALSDGALLQGTASHPSSSDEGVPAVFARQLDDFVEAIQGGRPPLVTGAEGERSVSLIEGCYAAREPLQYPWEVPVEPTPHGPG